MNRRELFGGAIVALLGSNSSTSQAAQDDFQTEVRLAVDSRRLSRALAPAGERRLTEVLKARLPILALEGGSVEFRAANDIRLTAPTPSVPELQLQVLRRIGRLELRYLDDIETSHNRRGRYRLEQRQVQETVRVRVGEGKEAREIPRTRQTVRTAFRDRDSNRLVTIEEMLDKSPLLATTGDIRPGGARATIEGIPAVRVEFRAEVSRKLARFHEKPGRLLGLFLDSEFVGLVSSAAEFTRDGKGGRTTPGTDWVEISGSFSSPEEAGYVAVVLNSGELPAPLTVISTRLIAK